MGIFEAVKNYFSSVDLKKMWMSIKEFFSRLWGSVFGKKGEDERNIVEQDIKLGIPDEQEIKEDNPILEAGIETGMMTMFGIGGAIKGKSVGSGLSSMGKYVKGGAPLMAGLDALQGVNAYRKGNSQAGDQNVLCAVAWGINPIGGAIAEGTKLSIEVANYIQRYWYAQKNNPLENKRMESARNQRGQEYLEQVEKQVAMEWGLWDEVKDNAFRQEERGGNVYAHFPLPKDVKEKLYSELNKRDTRDIPETEKLMQVDTKEMRLLSFWSYREMVSNTHLDQMNEAKRIQDSSYNDPNRWWNKVFFWRSSAEAFNKANKDPRAMSDEQRDALALQRREYDVAVALGIRENAFGKTYFQLTKDERLILYKQLNLIKGDQISLADEEKFKCLNTIPRDKIHVILRISKSENGTNNQQRGEDTLAGVSNKKGTLEQKSPSLERE